MAIGQIDIALSAESRLAFEFDIKPNPPTKKIFKITSGDSHDLNDGNGTNSTLAVFTLLTEDQPYNQPKLSV